MATAVLDSDIRTAVQAQGFADCSVLRQVKFYRPDNELECGSWYLLFVVYRDGMRPQLWGRRRTMQELLMMAQRGPIF